MNGTNFFTPSGVAGEYVALTDENGLPTLVRGTTVPTSGSYAKGCLFIKSNATTGVKALYENQGTTTSVSFNLVGDIATAEIADGAVTRAKLSAAAQEQSIATADKTVATTGNTDWYVIAPQAGSVASIDFSGVDALAVHDTNYLTFSVTNLGQAGAGNTAILAATDANTTKATGGSALVANGKRSLSLHGTAANLVVAKGDRLLVRAASAATLANTVTFSAYTIRFNGTT